MRHPWSLLPALLAVAATTMPTVASADPGSPLPDQDRAVPASRAATAPVRQAAQPARRQGESALEVTIDALSPSYLPAQGPVRVKGTLTNHTDERWVAINLHLFIADTPITSPSELAEAAELDPAVAVGDRITAPGTFDTVTTLEPGASAPFSISVGRSALGVTEPGVYWFGVHALGESDEPRDAIADGRARTFLPLVPRGRGSVNTALVIPIRHEVRYSPGGRIIDPAAWARTLDTGGSLRSLVDFGAAAGSRPVTWLVDPAVPDAVRDLVAGNPPRPLDETVPVSSDGTASPSASPGPSDSLDPESPTGEPEETPEGAPQNAATEPGAAWLERLREALGGDEVLTLPYGDLDVSAAAERQPEMYEQARRRTGAVLDSWDLDTTAANASPNGYLRPEALRMIDPRSTTMVTDRMFTGPAPSVARVSGQTVTVTASGVAEGGPGPGDPLALIAVRQRILSEAALRLLSPGQLPLVVVLPTEWNPGQHHRFLLGTRRSLAGPHRRRRGHDRACRARRRRPARLPREPGGPGARRSELRVRRQPDPDRGDPRRRARPQRCSRRQGALRSPQRALLLESGAPRRLPGGGGPVAAVHLPPAVVDPGRGATGRDPLEHDRPVLGHDRQQPRPPGAGPGRGARRLAARDQRHRHHRGRRRRPQLGPARGRHHPAGRPQRRAGRDRRGRDAPRAPPPPSRCARHR